MTQTKKLLLIDGNSIMNRGYYGLPEMTNHEGLHTNAVLGFLNIIFKVIDEEQPGAIAVAFDLHAPTFRHKMYEAYKGTRKSMDPELREQFPVIKELLRAMGITIIEKEGLEADDIIGTMSVKGEAAGYKVTVLSGDRDLLQLATDSVLIRIPKTKGGKTTVEDYYAADVLETYKVTPKEFIDLKGLMGDTSDNIPGVPKVGPKTAEGFITKYHSIENLYEHIDEVKAGATKNNLIEFKDQAFLSKVLATIKLDCELSVEADDTVVSEDKIFSAEAYEILNKLELKSFLNRFDFNKKSAKTEEIKNVTLTTEGLDDFLKAASESGHVGLFPVTDEAGALIGSSAAIGDTVYFIKDMGGLTTDGIYKTLQESNVTVSFISIKENIKLLGIEPEDEAFDISIAAYLLNPIRNGYEYSDIARDYLDKTFEDKKELLGKTALNIFTLDEENVRKYMTYGAYTAFHAYDRLSEKIFSDERLGDLYTRIEYPLIFVLLSMEEYGIAVNRNELISFGDNLKIRIEALKTFIYNLAGEEFNINSTKKLGEILFEKLGLPSGKKTKTGYSTNADVLLKLKGEHEIIPAILEYRQLTKLLSTYVEGLLTCIASDGRIHSHFNQTVTATGRISSTDPNLQNIPMRTGIGRELRKVFIPREDYVFVDADYSQIELRCMAHLSGDEKLIGAFLRGDDIHTMTASEVFGVPQDKVDSDMRRKAKAVNFGIIYGISSFGLGQDLDISRKEAQEYIDKYFMTYPKVRKYLDEQVSSAKETGYVATYFGRIRPVPEINSSNFMQRGFGERIAMNSPVQGTAADIIKLAMTAVTEELKKRNLRSRLILQIHDELLIEAQKDEAAEVEALLKEAMENVVALEVPLIVDVHSGLSLYDTK